MPPLRDGPWRHIPSERRRLQAAGKLALQTMTLSAIAKATPKTATDYDADSIQKLVSAALMDPTLHIIVLRTTKDHEDIFHAMFKGLTPVEAGALFEIYTGAYIETAPAAITAFNDWFGRSYGFLAVRAVKAYMRVVYPAPHPSTFRRIQAHASEGPTDLAGAATGLPASCDPNPFSTNAPARIAQLPPVAGGESGGAAALPQYRGADTDLRTVTTRRDVGEESATPIDMMRHGQYPRAMKSAENSLQRTVDRGESMKTPGGVTRTVKQASISRSTSMLRENMPPTEYAYSIHPSKSTRSRKGIQPISARPKLVNMANVIPCYGFSAYRRSLFSVHNPSTPIRARHTAHPQLFLPDSPLDRIYYGDEGPQMTPESPTRKFLREH
ncbi:hypothetical protein C8J57DRAFT_1388934 [Mycena rebaudengoi]|nr:hypothetical protein C8J57DRAFT_1388934 [Mycena rebaudengoi]